MIYMAASHWSFDGKVIDFKNTCIGDNEGKWCEERAEPTSEFISVIKRSECAIEYERLAKKIDDLKCQVSELKKQNKDYDKVDRNLIYMVRKMVRNLVVEEVNKNNPEINAWSWGSLTTMAEVRLGVALHIDDARRRLGINDKQWGTLTD